MARVLLDTHVWAWTLTVDNKRLPKAMRDLMEDSDVCVSSVSVYEITQKVRLGKWSEMTGLAGELAGALAWQSADLVSVDAKIALHAAQFDWPHRDPFDRLIAATALVEGLVLISADPVFDQMPGLRRVWD